jgi:acetylornithine deacetylase/succinyl-diaminopimelate desuccinylase family protein
LSWKQLIGRSELDEVVELTSRLVQLPSVNPPGDEGPVAEHLRDWLAANGIEARLEEVEAGRPNLIASVGPRQGTHLLYNGHTDVVPPGEGWSLDPFSGRIQEGRVYGRGANDMKGAVAAMAVALKALIRVEGDLGGRVTLTAVVGEEVNGLGTRALVKAGVKADFAVVGEPTELAICPAHKGNLTLKIEAHGRSAHASTPHEGVNAIMGMVKLAAKIEQYGERIRALTHPLLGTPTVNIGVIRGGTKSNIVPDYCVLHLDRRLVPPEDCDRALEEVKGLVAEVAQEDPRLRFNVEVMNCTGPSELKGGEQGLRALKEAITAVLGRPAETRPFVATCDAYHLNHGAGIPTVIMGPGSIDRAHIIDEYIGIEELHLATKIYLQTALNLLI